MHPATSEPLRTPEPPPRASLSNAPNRAKSIDLDEAALRALAAQWLAQGPDAETLADSLFDRTLATAPLRQLLAEGRWDGRMPQLECGRFGELLGRRDPAGPDGLREAGHTLRRSGLAPGAVLAGYAHHLDLLLQSLAGGPAESAVIPAAAVRGLVGAIFADAAEVLDAHAESQAERAAAAERQVHALFHSMPVGVVVLDHELRVLRANGAFNRMFGWVIAKEVLGRGIGETTRIAQLPRMIDAAMLKGSPVQDLMAFRAGEDGRRAYTCDIEPISGEAGAAALVVLRDITERHRQREAAERLQAAIDLSHDAMLLVDPQSLRYVAVNTTACRVLGYTRRELLALGPQDILGDAEIAAIETSFARLAAAGEGGEVFRTTMLRRDGRDFPVEIAQRSIRVGEQTLVVVAARDLSDREDAQARLFASEALYRQTFEHTAVGIAHVACDGRWLRVNERLCEIVGYPREELLQKTFQDITHPEDLDADLEYVAAMLRGDIPRYSMEKRYLRQDGQIVWILLTVSLVRDEGGAPRHFISVVEDIHARKAAQEENRALLLHLEERVKERTAALASANRDLEAFSYSVSHDLRAPLRSVGGFAKALELRYRSALDEVGAGYVHRLVEAVTRMDRLIEDLLRHAQAGNSVLKRVPLDLAALATEVLHRLAASEPQRRVHWQIGRMPSVSADAGLVGVAIENLLSNAWKFTSGNGVAHIGVTSEDDGQGEPVFVVRDDGVGFAPEQAERLFQPFQRLHEAAAFPGCGIGLATVARIVERHGGRIWAESRPGEGAVFRFTLGGQVREGSCRE